MKGLVFTEFIEMVESKFGFETTDKIIENAQLESNGIYTAVGTYPVEEMLALLNELNSETEIPIPDLLIHFGGYLFERFTVLYSHFFKDLNSTFEVMSLIENHIHVEVLKLYPDAMLPTIDVTQSSNDTMVVLYKSERKLGMLALGLIKGCAEFFKENITIKHENVKADRSEMKFTLTKTHG